MPITVALMRESELDAVDAVVMAAYNVPQSRRSSISLYLTLQPDGTFVAKDGETIVGFGAALDYGSFAYIGLMSVHPSMQKRGVGRLLLEHLLSWLDMRSCPTVLLDASPAGTPLYEQYDFVEIDTTMVLRRTQEEHDTSFSSYSHISLLREQEMPSLVAFDAPLFGAARGAVLASYYNPGRVLIARDSHTQLTGYLVAQFHTLGPWVAQSAEDAELLLLHALTLPFSGEPGVFVSAQHHDALALLKRSGFVWQRELKHMCRGRQIERPRNTCMYGQASLGLG